MLANYLSRMKAGILGGGQLGRMLLQAAANYTVETYVLENDPACPAAHLCHHFVGGDIKDYDTVYKFGQGLDALTIEIENVNVDALTKLEAEGVKIYPNTKALKTIKNKIAQKQFYNAQEIPTAEYIVCKNETEVRQNNCFLPAVNKLAEGGYDGRGVQLIKTNADFDKAFAEASVLEKMIDIKKEVAVIVAVGRSGETAIYPATEMFFDPYLNLLDFQLSPAELSQKAFWKIEAIALKLVKAFDSPGLFAVEMFVDRNDDVFVNETAPRVHNSGHHTIEANYCSQYDMLWRIILGYPLGDTEAILPSAIVNVIGAPDAWGPAHYNALEEILKIDKAFVHLYGKKETKPGRKMGHITVISKERQELLHQANRIKHVFKVRGKNTVITQKV